MTDRGQEDAMMIKRAFPAAALALTALTAACATPQASTGPSTNAAPSAVAAPFATTPVATTATAPAAASATQWVLSCQPHQQAQIRQTVRDGVPTAEVTCIDQAPATAGAMQYGPGTAPYGQQYGYAAAPEDMVTYRSQGIVQPQAVRTTPAVYRVQERPVREVVRRSAPRRSWQKSAVIIGSSAGIGAGVGAAVGGKKGALIGAAVGGGGAAIWDQVTRNK